MIACLTAAEATQAAPTSVRHFKNQCRSKSPSHKETAAKLPFKTAVHARQDLTGVAARVRVVGIRRLKFSDVLCLIRTSQS